MSGDIYAVRSMEGSASASIARQEALTTLLNTSDIPKVSCFSIS